MQGIPTTVEERLPANDDKKILTSWNSTHYYLTKSSPKLNTVYYYFSILMMAYAIIIKTRNDPLLLKWITLPE